MAIQGEGEPLLRPEDIDSMTVYPFIHMIRTDVMHFIDTPLTYEALTAPDLTYTLIRPLAEKYISIQQSGNMSIVFCLLLNRVYFVRDQGLTTVSLSRTRATLCEILAIRCMREYADNLLDLALVATTSWPVFNGADPMVMAQARQDNDDLEDRVGNAIEMAIISRGKGFIKSDPCQKVIDAIWSGKCVYQADSSHSILSDTYKRTPIHFYNPHTAPLLDHYRLKVPAIRSVLEYTNFLILFVLFILAIELNSRDSLNGWEVAFIVYALGFSLEKVAAMQEHGIKVYFTGTWNGFDLAFVTIYFSYASLRIYGIYHHSLWARETGTNCLALIACLMFPRLAFVTLRNNLMVLSLRAMIAQFAALMLIAAFCFGGFLYALWTFARDDAGYPASTIAWWMLDLWFGLDASGFENASKFNSIFGPPVLVTYACLSNTLLLTVLVSILSHTFSTINDDAAAEAMFRRAVSTIEGVKADYLFSYQPPINLLALVIMLPASYLLSPRWFHKVNVFMIRLTSFPILITVAIYERHARRIGTTGFGETFMMTTEHILDTLPRQLKRLTIFDGLTGGGAEIDAIFDIEEELDSALDPQDSGILPPPMGSERSTSASRHSLAPSHSQSQRRRSSTHTTSRPFPTSNPSSPTTPTKDKERSRHNSTNNSPQSPTSHTAGHFGHHPIRQRVNSALNRGAEMAQSFTSPLAQIYQPLVVDTDIPEEDHPQAGTLEGVSYGPVMRRRLSSMARRPTGMDIPRRMGVGSHGGGARHGQGGPSFDALLSESPDQREHEPAVQEEADQVSNGKKVQGNNGEDPGESKSQPKTVGDTENKEEAVGTLQWQERLIKMEERQARIENILMEISKHVGVK